MIEQPIPIHTLLSSPAQYDGQAVNVSGDVTNVVKVPFVEPKFFTLKDTSGEITVVTYEALPQMNSKQNVSGMFSTVAVAGSSSVGAHLTIGSPRANNRQ